MHYSGIDEAGLGPTLGPYVMSRVDVVSTGDGALFEVYGELLDGSGRKADALQVMDSKQLYSPASGLKKLERAVLAFAGVLLGNVPRTLGELLEGVVSDKGRIQDIDDLEWYAGWRDVVLPLGADVSVLDGMCERIRAYHDERGIELRCVDVQVLTEARLNVLYDLTDNKAVACRHALDPLVSGAFGDGVELLTIDRQGGRSFYGDWLMDLTGQMVMAQGEGKDGSRYVVGGQKVQLLPKADDKHFDVALASCFAKYVREVMMGIFNDYWGEKVSGLKATAGYPQDAKRWLGEIEAAGIGVDRARLVRSR